MKKFTSNAYWFMYKNTEIELNETAGKYIAYIRCDNYTTNSEREQFFRDITILLEKNYSLPVAGKIAYTVSNYNLCAFLFYCNESQKDLLYSSLQSIKPLLNNQYQLWLEPCPDKKIITWNWKWKSDKQTLTEIQNKTHWTYRTGIRK